MKNVLKTEVETNSDTFNAEVIEKLREAARRSVAHLPVEEQTQFLASFEHLANSSNGDSMARASALSIVVTLEAVRQDLDQIDVAIVQLARNLDHHHHGRFLGPATFSFGNAAGAVETAARSLAFAAHCVRVGADAVAQITGSDQKSKPTPEA